MSNVIKAVTDRQVANTIFNEMLVDLPSLGNLIFRRTVRKLIINATGCTSAACNSKYNFAKRKAVKNGLTADFSTSKEVGTLAEWDIGLLPVAQADDKWVIVNKATQKPVAYCTSKRKAYAIKTSAEVVRAL